MNTDDDLMCTSLACDEVTARSILGSPAIEALPGPRTMRADDGADQIDMCPGR